MWNAFRYTNFKGYKSSELHPLSRLTVLIGPNGGGKSTIIQGLLLLKQTAASTDTSSALIPDGKLVSMGGYKDFVYMGNTKKRIRFDFRWSGTGNAEEMDVEFGMGQNGQIYVNQLNYYDLFHRTLVSLNRSRKSNTYSIDLEAIQASQQNVPEPMQEWDKKTIYPQEKQNFTPLSFHRFSPDVLASVGSAIEGELRGYPSSLEFKLSNTYYLGPLRELPERYQVNTGERPAFVDPKGSNAVTVLYSNMENGLIEKTSRWLRELDIAEGLEMEQIKRGDLYGLKILGKGQSYKVNIRDFGFGASQILPVILESVFSPNDISTVLIEQPEIHLNAHHQLKLPDFFADLVMTSQKQFIIETHSEYFIKRLGTLVAKQVLDPHEISILYCYADESGSHITPIHLDDLGRFDYWPENFLSEGFEGATEHLEAMEKRMESDQDAY